MLMQFKKVKQELGFANAMLYAFDRILSRSTGSKARFIKYYIYVQPVPAEPLLPKRRGSSVKVMQVPSSSPLTADFPRPVGVIARRYADGCECLAAYEKGSFAGFLWLAFGRYTEDEVRCEFQWTPTDRFAWDFDVYVVPTHRLGLTFPRLWDTANAVMRERGMEATLSRISAFNPGSLVAHARLGARRLASASFLLLGPFQLMIASVPPFVHLSTSPGVPPTLKFRVDPSEPKKAVPT